MTEPINSISFNKKVIKYAQINNIDPDEARKALEKEKERKDEQEAPRILTYDADDEVIAEQEYTALINKLREQQKIETVNVVDADGNETGIVLTINKSFAGSKINVNYDSATKTLRINAKKCVIQIDKAEDIENLDDIDVVLSGMNVKLNSNEHVKSISSTAINCIINGSNDADDITATGANTTINARGGADTINSQGSGAIVRGGSGNDSITSSGIKTNIFAGEGDDNIFAQGLDVFVDEGAGQGNINVSGGNIAVDAGISGNTTITGAGTNISAISGNAANDVQLSGANNEVQYDNTDAGAVNPNDNISVSDVLDSTKNVTREADRTYDATTGLNTVGYDRNGYITVEGKKVNFNGYDENGFDENGLNALGYNAQGYDSEGFNVNGYNSQGFDKDGYNVQGYNPDKIGTEEYYKGGYNEYGFDENGYDKDGYDRYGVDRNGNKKENNYYFEGGKLYNNGALYSGLYTGTDKVERLYKEGEVDKTKQVYQNKLYNNGIVDTSRQVFKHELYDGGIKVETNRDYVLSTLLCADINDISFERYDENNRLVWFESEQDYLETNETGENLSFTVAYDETNNTTSISQSRKIEKGILKRTDTYPQDFATLQHLISEKDEYEYEKLNGTDYDYSARCETKYTYNGTVLAAEIDYSEFNKNTQEVLFSYKITDANDTTFPRVDFGRDTIAFIAGTNLNELNEGEDGVWTDDEGNVKAITAQNGQTIAIDSEGNVTITAGTDSTPKVYNKDGVLQTDEPAGPTEAELAAARAILDKIGVELPQSYSISNVVMDAELIKGFRLSWTSSESSQYGLATLYGYEGDYTISYYNDSTIKEINSSDKNLVNHEQFSSTHQYKYDTSGIITEEVDSVVTTNFGTTRTTTLYNNGEKTGTIEERTYEGIVGHNLVLPYIVAKDNNENELFKIDASSGSLAIMTGFTEVTDVTLDGAKLKFGENTINVVVGDTVSYDETLGKIKVAHKNADNTTSEKLYNLDGTEYVQPEESEFTKGTDGKIYKNGDLYSGLYTDTDNVERLYKEGEVDTTKQVYAGNGKLYNNGEVDTERQVFNHELYDGGVKQETNKDYVLERLRNYDSMIGVEVIISDEEFDSSNRLVSYKASYDYNQESAIDVIKNCEVHYNQDNTVTVLEKFVNTTFNYRDEFEETYIYNSDNIQISMNVRKDLYENENNTYLYSVVDIPTFESGRLTILSQKYDKNTEEVYSTVNDYNASVFPKLYGSYCSHTANMIIFNENDKDNVDYTYNEADFTLRDSDGNIKALVVQDGQTITIDVDGNVTITTGTGSTPIVYNKDGVLQTNEPDEPEFTKGTDGKIYKNGDLYSGLYTDTTVDNVERLYKEGEVSQGLEQYSGNNLWYYNGEIANSVINHELYRGGVKQNTNRDNILALAGINLEDISGEEYTENKLSEFTTADKGYTINYDNSGDVSTIVATQINNPAVLSTSYYSNNVLQGTINRSVQIMNGKRVAEVSAKNAAEQEIYNIGLVLPNDCTGIINVTLNGATLNFNNGSVINVVAGDRVTYDSTLQKIKITNGTTEKLYNLDGTEYVQPEEPEFTKGTDGKIYKNGDLYSGLYTDTDNVERLYKEGEVSQGLEQYSGNNLWYYNGEIANSVINHELYRGGVKQETNKDYILHTLVGDLYEENDYQSVSFSNEQFDVQNRLVSYAVTITPINSEQEASAGTLNCTVEYNGNTVIICEETTTQNTPPNSTVTELVGQTRSFVVRNTATYTDGIHVSGQSEIDMYIDNEYVKSTRTISAKNNPYVNVVYDKQSNPERIFNTLEISGSSPSSKAFTWTTYDTDIKREVVFNQSYIKLKEDLTYDETDSTWRTSDGEIVSILLKDGWSAKVEVEWQDQNVVISNVIITTDDGTRRVYNKDGVLQPDEPANEFTKGTDGKIYKNGTAYSGLYTDTDNVKRLYKNGKVSQGLEQYSENNLWYYNGEIANSVINHELYRGGVKQTTNRDDMLSLLEANLYEIKDEVYNSANQLASFTKIYTNAEEAYTIEYGENDTITSTAIIDAFHSSTIKTYDAQKTLIREINRHDQYDSSNEYQYTVDRAYEYTSDGKTLTTTTYDKNTNETKWVIEDKDPDSYPNPRQGIVNSIALDESANTSTLSQYNYTRLYVDTQGNVKAIVLNEKERAVIDKDGNITITLENGTTEVYDKNGVLQTNEPDTPTDNRANLLTMLGLAADTQIDDNPTVNSDSKLTAFSVTNNDETTQYNVIYDTTGATVIKITDKDGQKSTRAFDSTGSPASDKIRGRMYKDGSPANGNVDGYLYTAGYASNHKTLYVDKIFVGYPNFDLEDIDNWQNPSGNAVFSFNVNGSEYEIGFYGDNSYRIKNIINGDDEYTYQEFSSTDKKTEEVSYNVSGEPAETRSLYNTSTGKKQYENTYTAYGLQISNTVYNDDETVKSTTSLETMGNTAYREKLDALYNAGYGAENLKMLMATLNNNLDEGMIKFNLTPDALSDVDIYLNAVNEGNQAKTQALNNGQTQAQAEAAYTVSFGSSISNALVPVKTTLDTAKSTTSVGDVVEVGDKLYVNDGTNMVELKMTKAQYLDLFPVIDRYATKQGGMGDCYLISGILIGALENKTAFSKLIQMFEYNGNDLTITFDGMKDYPVTFTNGELRVMDRRDKDGSSTGITSQATACKGVQLLEQAYAIACFAQETDTKIDDIDIDGALTYIENGWNSIAQNKVFGGMQSEYKYLLNTLDSTIQTNVNNVFNNADNKNNLITYLEKDMALKAMEGDLLTILNHDPYILDAVRLLTYTYYDIVKDDDTVEEADKNVWHAYCDNGVFDYDGFKTAVLDKNPKLLINNLSKSAVIQCANALKNIENYAQTAYNYYDALNALDDASSGINNRTFMALVEPYNEATYLDNIKNKNMSVYNALVADQNGMLTELLNSVEDGVMLYGSGTGSEGYETPQYYLTSGHAYYIAGVNKVLDSNGDIDWAKSTVEVVNPWAGALSVTVPVSEFTKVLAGLFVEDLSKIQTV